MNYKVLKSAYKHNIKHEDIVEAYKNAVSGFNISNSPMKIMLFGFDTKCRALEIGVDKSEKYDKIMHAMKIRKSYEKYLQKWKGFDII